MARPSSSGSVSKDKHRHKQTKIFSHFSPSSKPNKLKSATQRDESDRSSSSPDPEMQWSLGPATVAPRDMSDVDDAETSDSSLVGQSSRRRETSGTGRRSPSPKRTKLASQHSRSTSDDPIDIVDTDDQESAPRPTSTKKHARDGGGSIRPSSNGHGPAATATKPRSDSPRQPSRKKHKPVFISLLSDEEDTTLRPGLGPSTQVRSVKSSSSQHVKLASKRALSPAPPRRSNTIAAAATGALSGDDDDDLPDVGAAISHSLAAKDKGKGKKPDKRSKPTKKRLAFPDDSDDDQDDADRRSRQKPQKTSRPADDDSDERRAAQRRKDKGKGREVDPPPKKKVAVEKQKQPREKRRVVDSDDDPSEDSEDAARRKRRGSKEKKKKERARRRADSSSSGSEGASEEDDLMDDAGKAYANPASRLRAKGVKKTPAQLALEKIKKNKKRNEQKALKATQAPEPSSSFDSLFDASRSDDEKEAEPDVSESAWMYVSTDDSEETDDDFQEGVIEDDTTFELPAAFRTVQPIERDFAVVVDFHFHLIIDGISWLRKRADMSYYGPALQRVRDNMLGHSRVLPTGVWKSYFAPAMERYPTFNKDAISLDRGESYPRCATCGSEKKPGKVAIVLTGEEYDRETFKPLVKPPASESSSSDDDESDDDLPDGPDDREFNCGVICASRAQVYHEMIHWEWRLHMKLKRQVRKLPDKAGGGKPSKKDASAVVEYFDKQTLPMQEYKEYRRISVREPLYYQAGYESD